MRPPYPPQSAIRHGSDPSDMELVRAAHAMGRPGWTLAEFVAEAWHVVEPETPLVWNWHLDAICAHVEAQQIGTQDRRRHGPDRIVSRARSSWTQNLIINVPPGSMKSLILNVFTVAWVWLWRPGWRVICASGNPRIAIRDSVRCRDLIASEWYRKTFRIGWNMADDQDAKGNFKNQRNGSRLAITCGAKVTGDRADALFVDDPNDANEIRSKAHRTAINSWWDAAFANRVNDPKLSTRTIIMQRLHEDDLTGHLLEKERVERLVIPMEHEPGRAATFLGWIDPRRREKELMFSERFPPEVLYGEGGTSDVPKGGERLRLGSSGFAGQMQQRPAPEEGERFKREWWRFYTSTPRKDELGYLKNAERPQGCNAYPPALLPTKFDEVIDSWDMTFKEGHSTDYVCGLKIGRVGANKYILGRYHKQANYADTKKAVIALHAAHPDTYEVIIEDKANGPAVVTELGQVIAGLIAVTPEGGKESRAAACEPGVEAGNWYLPDGMEWEDFIDELAAFPHGRHDDYVDAFSQAGIRFLQDTDERTAKAMLGL